MKEDRGREDQEVEGGTLEIDQQTDIGSVNIEVHVIIEAGQKAQVADTEIEMITLAIGTAEGHAERP